jgi:hypothetical protein
MAALTFQLDLETTSSMTRMMQGELGRMRARNADLALALIPVVGREESEAEKAEPSTSAVMNDFILRSAGRRR